MRTDIIYRGFKIMLQERVDSWSFKIDGGGDADGDDLDGRSYDAVAAAKLAIDEHHAKLAKASKVAFTPVDMLTRFGTPVRVRGMHGATSKLLMDTDEKRPFGSVYPATPIVASMLLKRVKLEDELRELNAVVEDLSLPTRRISYGRIDNPEQFNRMNGELIRDIAARREAAEALSAKREGGA